MSKQVPVSCDCITNNLVGQMEFSENIEGIDEWPHKTPNGEVSYRLNNYTGDTLPKWQESAVTVAFRAWQLRLEKLRFRRERNPDVSVIADISFEPEDHFSSRNVFGHGYFPGQGDISGDVHINDESWDWVPNVHLSDLAHPPLVPFLIHEFGHSIIGLRHDTASSSNGKEIMYPSMNLGNPLNKIGPRTLYRAQVVKEYGVRNIPNFWIRYFMTRRNLGWDFY